MAKMRDFNPKAVLVVRKASGLTLGGRRYLQGQAIKDDCISLRKRQQLYGQNFLCYPHDLPEGAAEAAVVREAGEQTEEVEGLEGDGTAQEVQENGLTEIENRADENADASRPDDYVEESEQSTEEVAEEESEAESEGDDDADKSGEEGSSEPSKPSASKKKRARKPKS